MLRALLIRRPYVEDILAGRKTWEIRGSRIGIRETIALVASGSGTVIGVCEVVDCIGTLTQDQFRKNASKAGMPKKKAILGWYRQTFAWVLAKPKYLKKPVSYKHPYGAMAWAKLDRSVEPLILKQR
jgi:hypothetical protein